ncbi:PIN domain-containing protein [Spiribacter sp. 221]|uniref:PIN domain-containing protein n=1 Tax=Spiribacter onubensis TaxID=3122420 RepID=UPI00349FC90B
MILLDINVLLDVLQRREPHYTASARVINAVVRKQIEGVLSAHAITTVDYLVTRHSGAQKSREVVDWLLSRFTIAAIGRPELLRAQSLAWEDFEDAVTTAAAESMACEVIVTRDARVFARSSIMVCTPEEFLMFDGSQTR